MHGKYLTSARPSYILYPYKAVEKLAFSPLNNIKVFKIGNFIHHFHHVTEPFILGMATFEQRVSVAKVFKFSEAE